MRVRNIFAKTLRRAPLSLLVGPAFLVFGWANLQAAAASDPSGSPKQIDPFEAGSVEAVLDSLRNTGEPTPLWESLIESAGWDTLGTETWIPNADNPAPRSPAWRRFRRSFRPQLGFNKVDGLVSGVGVSTQWMKRPGLRLEGAMMRSSGRGRYQGEFIASWQSDARASLPYSWASRSRLTGGSKEARISPFANGGRQQRAWSGFGGYSERTVPFGSNRPLGNAAQSLILALDEQSYLDRIESFAGIRQKISRTIRSEWVYIDRKDRPIESSRSPHLQTSPRAWKNAPSDRQHIRGVSWMGEWIPGGQRLEAQDGLWLKAAAWGGALGGDRELYTTGFEARQTWPVPGRGTLEVEGWASAVGGDPATQDLTDLGGATSLRGYPARSQVGTTSLLLRTDYSFGLDLLAKTNVPWIRSFHLQPVVFFDVGAAWGTRGWQSISDLTLPESQDWKTDIGLGVQRLVNYPGLLTRVRVDFGWRLDRAEDRFRASLSLTR